MTWNCCSKEESFEELPQKVKKMFEAFASLMEQGADIHELKVSDITKEAGIGKGTAYEYFSSKEELISKAQLYYFNEKFISMRESVEGATTFEEAIELMCEKTEVFLDKRSGLEVMLRNAAREADADLCHRKTEDQAKEGLSGFFTSLAKKAVEEGSLKEKDPERISLVLLTELIGYGIAYAIREKTVEKKETDEAWKQKHRTYCKEAIYAILG
ncbi:MAG: TetR/AcrR family transcriptional regulator [Lachnospiraceae bacterium]|nr:TetR/AcrR family transcriptional regulator [Lachnospiraceae bacterium]